MSLPNLDIERLAGTFGYPMVLVFGLVLLLSILILRATVVTPIDFGRGMMTVFHVFFDLIGNVMGKLRRNFFMGVRTPWTVASEKV